jgi:hypothetical protein
MINTLKRILNLETKDLNGRIRSRVDNLQTCTERLELRKENLFLGDDAKDDLKDIYQKIHRITEKREDLITISSELRKLNVLQHMKDDQIFRLSKFVKIEGFVHGRKLTPTCAGQARDTVRRAGGHR